MVIKKLLEEKLAGCANFFNRESSYWWEGKIVNDKEVSVILKTSKNKRGKPKLKETSIFCSLYL